MEARQDVWLLEETTTLAATQHSIELSETYRLKGDHVAGESGDMDLRKLNTAIAVFSAV